jgi:transcription antitermination factor NusG
MISSDIRWYAVRTKPQHENTVSQILDAKGYERLLPTYRTRVRWADRIKEMERPLFPGYLFCRFDARCRVPILNTAGVIDIVRVAGHPAAIEDYELANLKTAMGSGYTCLPWPHAEIGRKITIGFGPMAGVTGVLVEVKRKLRLVLSVSAVNRAILVEVDADVLAPETIARPLAVAAFAS